MRNNHVAVAAKERSPRYSINAEAELAEVNTSMMLTATINSLSANGCFVDTLNPLPIGRELNVKISHRGETFAARSKVVYSTINLGMGIKFVSAEPDQYGVLQRWFATLP